MGTGRFCRLRTVSQQADTLKALDFVAKLGASFLILSVGPSMPVNLTQEGIP